MKKNNINKIFPIIICIICINCQIPTNLNKINNQKPSTKNTIKFQSEKNSSLIYDQKGKLTCKINTKYIRYLNEKKTIYLIKPNAILFNKTIPTWKIQAHKAHITHNKIMYLRGNVQIINLIKNSYLQSITTNTITLNLITYDIYSNEKTTIHGMYFNTITSNIQGNLREKTTKLSKKVYTTLLYETNNQKKK